jgi:hypothetical protein
MPQNSRKNKFLVDWNHFSYKNRLVDLVRGLFIIYDIRKYIPTTCRPLNTFLGPFGGAQMSQNGIKKNYFLAVPNYFSY